MSKSHRALAEVVAAISRELVTLNHHVMLDGTICSGIQMSREDGELTVILLDREDEPTQIHGPVVLHERYIEVRNALMTPTRISFQPAGSEIELAKLPELFAAQEGSDKPMVTVDSLTRFLSSLEGDQQLFACADGMYVKSVERRPGVRGAAQPVAEPQPITEAAIIDGEGGQFHFHKIARVSKSEVTVSLSGSRFTTSIAIYAKEDAAQINDILHPMHFNQG